MSNNWPPSAQVKEKPLNRYIADIPPPDDYFPKSYSYIVWWDYLACKRYMYLPTAHRWIADAKIPSTWARWLDQVREARGLPPAQIEYGGFGRTDDDVYEYPWMVKEEGKSFGKKIKS
jgi:hypothetical protein